MEKHSDLISTPSEQKAERRILQSEVIVLVALKWQNTKRLQVNSQHMNRDLASISLEGLGLEEI